MTATALDSRKAKIDEYVPLSAQDDFLAFVTHLAADDDGTAAARNAVLSSDLFGELWPDDDDLHGDDYLDAERRSASATADLLMALTMSEAQDALKAEALRMAGWTAPS